MFLLLFLYEFCMNFVYVCVWAYQIESSTEKSMQEAESESTCVGPRNPGTFVDKAIFLTRCVRVLC
jgi:hypothetical protein